MICPNCNIVNDAKHTFCTECGTVIPETSNDYSDEVATVIKKREELLATQMMPKPELQPTQIMPKPELPQPELPQTAYIPQEKPLPPTQHYSAPNTNENKTVPPTQHYSAPNTGGNTPLPRTQVVVPIVPPSNQPSNAKFDNPPKDIFSVPNAQIEPKKKSKVFKIGGILLLLLLIGGGVAVYFLAPPMQSSKSYFLTNKPNDSKNILEFDNQNRTFLMVGTSDNNFQKWQITPDPNEKTFYRFVNRGLGENQSLEVIDDNSDSSVSMAQSAKDVGQLWAITNVSGDFYRITNKWLGDSKSLSYTKQYYNFLRIRDSGNGDAQLWKKISAPTGQGFYLVNKQHGDTVFLQALKDGEFKDKLIVKSGESGNRQWDLNDLGTGFYTLTADGKALDVNASNKDRVMMSASGASSSQRWKMTPVGADYFRLTNESLGDGKSLEAVTFSRYVVEMVKSSDTDPAQLWKLTGIK